MPSPGTVARALDVDFYFPSPVDPDDDCPHWWGRMTATRCQSCGKPLVDDRGAYASKDECWPCDHKNRPQREIANDAPGDKPVAHCVVVDANVAVLRHLVLELHKSKHLARALEQRDPPIALTAHIDTVLTSGDITALVTSCERKIDEVLAKYVPADLAEDRIAALQTYSWRGVEHVIQTWNNRAGEALAVLFERHAFFSSCVGDVVRIVGNGGVTKRDVCVLSKLAAGLRLDAELPYLAADEIERTLAKLVARHLIRRDGDSIEVLPIGRLMTIAGPP